MNIGLLGTGTVGGGVIQMAGQTADLKIVKALTLDKPQGILTNDFSDIASDGSIDTVAEAMGGISPAYEYARASIEAGRNFITSNKLLVSARGAELDALARKKGVAFLFGAACGGGIPYLESLSVARESYPLDRVGGILNGTTNFMLFNMESRGLSYEQALAMAQELGYAERDPSSDVLGLDTARKIVLAIAVGFGFDVRPQDVPTFGISTVTPEDIKAARSTGRALKLCARASFSEGVLEARVNPVWCASRNPEGAVSRNFNMAWFDGPQCGRIALYGQGAGRFPTASNMIRDLRSIQAGKLHMLPETLKQAQPDQNGRSRLWYVRTDSGKQEIRATVGEIHRRFATVPGAFFAEIEEEE